MSGTKRPAKQKSWAVTIKGFGRVSTRLVNAPTRRAAEEKVLAEAGFEVTSKEATRWSPPR